MLTGCAARPKLPDYSHIPDFTLTDQTGALFSSAAQLHGHVWVADFIYTTCPGPCPRMSSQMHEVQTALSKDGGFRFVSFTVDPKNDTPPVLAAYAKNFDAKPGWFFLTGAESTLQRLCRNAFMLGNVDESLQHSTRFVLVDRDSQVRGYYETSDADAIPKLISDAKAIIRERG
ncbi:MAG: SCO family protein [Bryobacteraceae bacterium]